MTMKFNLNLMCAAAALAAAPQAFALPPSTASYDLVLNVSGASGMRGLIGEYVLSQCASGKDVFYNDNVGSNVTAWNNSNKAGELVRAYSCVLDVNSPLNGGAATGRTVLVQKSDGGSGQGTQPVARQTNITNGFMTINAASCTTTGATAAADTPSYKCKTGLTTYPDAGLSDVEPEVFSKGPQAGQASSPTAADLAALTVTPVILNVYGLGVSKDLYLALQKTQGIKPLSASVADADFDSHAAPSLPKAFVATALSGGLSAPSVGLGWHAAISSAVDSGLATRQVNVCRRTNTSGTQAGSNLFFLENYQNSSGKLSLQGATGTTGPTGTLAVAALGSSSLVEDCLGIVRSGTTITPRDGTGYYAIGHLTRENSHLDSAGLTPAIADEGWRFAAIDGVFPTTATAQDGRYGYAFESTLQWNTTRFDAAAAAVPATATVKLSDAQKAFLNAARTNIGVAAVLAVQPQDIKNGFLALPSSTASTNFDVFTAAEKLHTARVSRNGKSVNAITLVK